MNAPFSRPGILLFGAVGLVAVLVAGLIAFDNEQNADNTVASSSEVNATTSTENIAISDNDLPAADLILAGQHINFDTMPVPSLPFPDNPDPDECGIPVRWGSDNDAWLTGVYEGEMHQPIVYLYDGHGRSKVVAAALHGTQVRVLMFQANPVQNYYYVRIPNAPDGQQLGWVPAPFLSLEPLGT
jgi:hypothetical protein